MTIQILCRSPNETEFNLGRMVFEHRGCYPKTMRSRKAQGTNLWRLSCPCGLEISFPEFGEAVVTISFVTTDGEPRTLRDGSFESSATSGVEIGRGTSLA